MRILVTGSRMWHNKQKIYDILSQEVDVETDTLIHGGAMGADFMAQQWADKNGVETTIVRPVDRKNPSYLLHRNAEMVGMCDRVIAFCLRMSRGTLFTARYALARKKNTLLVEED